MNIKKLCVNILAMPIRNIEKRRAFRNFAINFTFADYFAYRKFVKSENNENSVLLFEPNACHGEVLPGFAKYFLDLGYSVDVLCHRDMFDEKPFSLFTSPNLRVFSSTPIFHNSALLKKITSYKYVFLSSSCYYHGGFDENGRTYAVIDKIPAIQQANLIVLEHDLADVERFNEERFIRANKLITIARLEKGIYVNPHYFGSIAEKGKNSKTRFIVVGAIVPFRKNFDVLIEALNSLIDSKLDFEVVVAGRGELDSIPDRIKPYIRICGRLNFPDMYKDLQEADFFLPLLDAENQEHERYITTGATGSAQLIYGFKLPPLIESKFANFYSFDNTNAIIYDKALDVAMKEAIEMNVEEYNSKIDNLNKLSELIYSESLANLREVVG